MIRTGIHKLNQLNTGSLKDIFGKEKNISIFLYHKISQIDNPERRIQFAEMILNRFNSDRNVIKRTYKNRFNNFDKSAIKLISEQNYSKISLFDVAISDGRASCFFLDQIINNLKNYYYTASDIQISYYLHRKDSRSKSYILTDDNNKIVEIIRPPFVWNMSRTEGSFYFINNFLKSLFFKRAIRELKDNKFKFIEEIELLHPDFKVLMERDKRFKVQKYNLFKSIPGKYTVIRAMNILHTGYFTRDQLYIILNNIFNGLENNGLLIEGSNENSGTPVEGAIYKRNESGFLLINEPEKSSRIIDIVLSFRPLNQNE